MVMCNLRMYMHSRIFNVYSVFFILSAVVLCSITYAAGNREFDSGDLDRAAFIFRHRRSYERHKTKETLMKTNGVKTSIGKSSTVFITENCTVVVAQIGGTATLPCVVRKIGSAVVSWLRKQDYHLLTVGLAPYNSDDRYMVEHVRHLQNWGLLIKKVNPSDAGLYECQISTHPPSSIIVELRVTKAIAEIQGAPDLYVHSGSRLRILCILKDSTEPPEYVFWYHEQRMINYDPGVFVKDSRASSVIQVEEADKSHNGNYTCSPSNAAPASINVHVLNATAEEKPAAMQHANSSSSTKLCYVKYGTLLVILLPFIQKT